MFEDDVYNYIAEREGRRLADFGASETFCSLSSASIVYIDCLSGNISIFVLE